VRRLKFKAVVVAEVAEWVAVIEEEAQEVEEAVAAEAVVEVEVAVAVQQGVGKIPHHSGISSGSVQPLL